MARFDHSRLERRIHFHRIHVDGDETGAIPYDAEPTLTALQQLLGRSEQYLEQGERITLCLPDSARPLTRMRLLNVRRTDLPQIENGGLLSPLELAPTAGLAEQIHVVFFPDNIVGSEFNFYGPRISRLAEFLLRRDIKPRIALRALLRDDVIEALDNFSELTAARIRVRRNDIQLVSRADRTLRVALDRVAEFSDDMEIELVIRRPAYSRIGLTERLRGAFRRLARDDQFREVARGLSVEGRNPATHDIEELNLLEADLVATRRILRANDRSRVLDSLDAYDQIGSAHEELRDAIQRSGSVRGA